MPQRLLATRVAGTPTFKNFADYQASFFNVIRDILVMACTVRRSVDNRILERPEFITSSPFFGDTSP